MPIGPPLKIWFTMSAEKLYTSSNDRETILLVSAQWSSNIQLSKQEEKSVFDEEVDGQGPPEWAAFPSHIVSAWCLKH